MTRETHIAQKLGLSRSSLSALRNFDNRGKLWDKRGSSIFWTEAGVAWLEERFMVKQAPAPNGVVEMEVLRSNFLNPKLVQAAGVDGAEMIRVRDSAPYRGSHRDGSAKRIEAIFQAGRWMEVRGERWERYSKGKPY